MFQIEWDLSNSEFAILVRWSLVEFIEENGISWLWLYKFTGISKKKINCVIFNAIYLEKISFVHRLYQNPEKTTNTK